MVGPGYFAKNTWCYMDMMGSVDTSKMHSRRANPLCISQVQGRPILQQQLGSINQSNQTILYVALLTGVLLTNIIHCASSLSFQQNSTPNHSSSGRQQTYRYRHFG